MRVIRNRRVERQRVVLDEHQFENCVFVDCTISYSGGLCTLIETRFDRPTLELSGAAANTAEVLRALGALNLAMFTFAD